jgi:hypothetical protein
MARGAGLHDVPAQRQIDREDEILAGGIVENPIFTLCATSQKAGSAIKAG